VKTRVTNHSEIVGANISAMDLAWRNGQIMRNSLTSGDATLQIMPELISSPGIVFC